MVELKVVRRESWTVVAMAERMVSNLDCYLGLQKALMMGNYSVGTSANLMVAWKAKNLVEMMEQTMAEQRVSLKAEKRAVRTVVQWVAPKDDSSALALDIQLESQSVGLMERWRADLMDLMRVEPRVVSSVESSDH